MLSVCQQHDNNKIEKIFRRPIPTAKQVFAGDDSPNTQCDPKETIYLCGQ